MKAGRLDRRITIMRATSLPGALADVVTWTDLATVWASKEDLRDSEKMKSKEVSAEITTRFQIRYSHTVASVNPKDKVRFDGKIFDIYGTKELGRREGIEITATARAD